MYSVTLGFRAFDAHELLCHFIAVQAGLYRRHGLQVSLEDITFIADPDLPGSWFQASCGAALTSAVSGIPQRVLFVGVDKPMFWIYATQNIKRLDELANRNLATFPAFAPPHRLANIVLARAGVTGSKSPKLHAARDDTARLGLLRSGHVDAAVISSAMAPARLKQLGFGALAFLGDELRVPTTGLGIDQSFVENEPELTRLMVDIHKESLALMHDDLKLVSRVLQDVFDVYAGHADATARQFIACYTKNGTTTGEIAQAAINAISDSLKLDARPDWREVYLF